MMVEDTGRLCGGRGVIETDAELPESGAARKGKMPEKTDGKKSAGKNLIRRV